ncbi:MAG: hypothetical protein A2Z47_11710 [Thermodesulfovibrio sp. RBG_19FT_COMBO_42_12]|nr:MAG: hypothetical protein A2Z47_11710 [Thermodesulfovibrio sp. RBG_19FT_COMBO_42_12]
MGLWLMGVSFLLFPAFANAAIQWSASAVTGYYAPRLDELNYILKNTAVELGPRNTEAKPSSYPVIYQGISPEMPEMSADAPRIGLQIQADLNPQYALVFGMSTAKFDSVKRDIRNFFVGFNIPAVRETRFSLSLNQFWFGAKRYWTFKDEGKQGEKSEVRGQNSEDGRDRPSGLSTEEGKQNQKILHSIKQNSRFYAEMGILAVTRAYLTTDVWMHVYAPEEGFDFYKVTETGISGSGFASYIGAGGEYYLNKWLSVALDINYNIGSVTEMKFDNYFTVDPLEKDIITEGSRAVYVDLKKGIVQPLIIDLEGWDMKGYFRVYF